MTVHHRHPSRRTVLQGGSQARCRAPVACRPRVRTILSKPADHADLPVAAVGGRPTAICARWPSWRASSWASRSSSSTSPAAAAPTARARWRCTAKPDGYTIAQYPLGMIRVAHMQKTQWHPLNDFSFIIGLTGYTFGFVVRSDSPYKTLPGLR